ncbi:MAG: hypothetical protein WBU20_05250, partial [Candidatus Acidiferrum sp.]
ILPDRTILAGHSMGAAIALRIAEKFRPAGVIAISPAPSSEAHGMLRENLLFHTPPHLTPDTLILVGQFEPSAIIDNAEELATNAQVAPVKFVKIPRVTHVGMMFSPTAARDAQEWAAHVLGLPNPENTPLPSRANLLGCFLGIVGVVLIAGPFIREMTGGKPASDPEIGDSVGRVRGAIEMAMLSMLGVVVLHYWVPLRMIHLFEGDYLSSFFLLAGLGLILLHLRLARKGFRCPAGAVIGAAVAAVLLHLLVTGWFELTATGSWLSLDRWLHLPLFAITAFAFFYGMELISGAVINRLERFLFWLMLPVLAWLALSCGVLYLRSGAILLVLLSPYFALLFVLLGLGIQLVRRESGSPTAAAVFGAILLAGFCLVLFPMT